MQDLPFQTPTQFIALALTLIAGWFLGLATRSGGGKWRARYHDEEMSHASYRDRAENDLRDAARRNRELEAENASLRANAPVVETREPEGHSTGTVLGAAAAGAVGGAAATHVVENHDTPPADEPPASDPEHL